MTAERARGEGLPVSLRMVSPAQVRAQLERREAARREAGERRASALRARLPAMAAALRAHGAARVVLFGSLAAGTPTSASDVDLAVEGLPPERFFAALAEVMKLAACPVDLVRLEEAPASLTERIAAEGKSL